VNPESADTMETEGEAPEEVPPLIPPTSSFLLAVEAELLETGE
jgi:hypothetical protein